MYLMRTKEPKQARTKHERSQTSTNKHEHERWDGGGYPDGLKGDEIPLGSRIIIAADTYHAITSDRPYRAKRSHSEAVDELTRCAGTQFDPNVTAALIGFLYGQRQAGSLA